MSEWGYNNKRTETFDHQPSIKQARLRKKRKRKKDIRILDDRYKKE